MAELQVQYIDPQELKPFADNPRQHSERNIQDIQRSIKKFGFTNPILVRQEDNMVVAGHGRLQSAQELGLDEVPVIYLDFSENDAKLYAITDNRTAETSEWDLVALDELVQSLELGEGELPDTGFYADELEEILAEIDSSSISQGEEQAEVARQTLSQRFLVPPFSVLDARQGYWQERKRAWLALGIESELGRGSTPSTSARAEDPSYREIKGRLLAVPSGSLKPAADYSDGQRGDGRGRLLAVPSGSLKPLDRASATKSQGVKGALAGDERASTGTSIFDPVLCELAYRWFCPPGGSVLDPFAGGSVRGIVAAKLGRRYVGVDLSGRQLEANRQQAETILNGQATVERVVTDPQELTPVQTVEMPELGPIKVKREDLFDFAGVRGSKARAGRAIALQAKGLTAGASRHSTMLGRVARLAEAVEIPARIHVANSKSLTPDQQEAIAHGAEMVPGKANYLKTLVASSRQDAEARGWTHLELGLESDTYTEVNRGQAANIPADTQRVVVCVGSGTGLSTVLHGLDDAGLGSVPVLGVRVGMEGAEKLLDRRGPANWHDRVTFVESSLDYASQAPVRHLGQIELDWYYEAKCLPFLQPGDLFYILAKRTEEQEPSGELRPEWIQGDSRQALPPGEFDFVFSCPPYFDLEVYSEEEGDISNMDYPDFLTAYRDIISQSCQRLKDNRLACFVVGEVRDKKGNYHNLIGDTIQAFLEAGLAYYNEAILVTSLGSLPIRAARMFSAGRKLGKTHQNVLVFLKGDAKQAVEALGEVALDESIFNQP